MTRRVLIAIMAMTTILGACTKQTSAQHTFAFIDEQGFPSIYDLRTRRVAWRAERPSPAQVGPTWSPDGSSLVYVSLDGDKAYVCHLNTLTMKSQHLAVDSGVFVIGSSWVWSPSGSYVAAIQTGLPAASATLIDTRSLAVVGTFEMSSKPLWSKDEKQLCYVLTYMPEKTTLRDTLIVADLQTGEAMVLLKAEPGYQLTAIAWTEDSAIIYVIENGSVKHVRDTKSREYSRVPEYVTRPASQEKPPESLYEDLATINAWDKNLAGEWLISGAQNGQPNWIVLGHTPDKKPMRVVKGSFVVWRPFAGK